MPTELFHRNCLVPMAKLRTIDPMPFVWHVPLPGLPIVAGPDSGALPFWLFSPHVARLAAVPYGPGCWDDIGNVDAV